jgi:hypothetical protein
MKNIYRILVRRPEAKRSLDGLGTDEKALLK